MGAGAGGAHVSCRLHMEPDHCSLVSSPLVAADRGLMRQNLEPEHRCVSSMCRSQYFSLENAFPVKQDTWHKREDVHFKFAMCICVLDMREEGWRLHLCQIQMIQQIGVYLC